MILFINVFITDHALNRYDRGLYPSVNSLDIFLYSLHSLSVIPFSNIIIYYQLDYNYKDREQELIDTIKKCFTAPTKIYNFRNGIQDRWQTSINELFNLPDEPVWFTCNHDHVFLDYDLKLLKVMENAIKTHNNRLVSCYLSHYPEQHRTFPKVMKYKTPHYICSHCICSDGIQIVTKELLVYWWWEVERDPLVFYPRSDIWNSSIPGVAVKSHDILLPFKELCRHFDGYKRNIIRPDLNKVPPLFIPQGFFENNMKIAYCGNKFGYISVNPLAETTTATDENGADLRCMIEDLPLFWKDKISVIEVINEIDKNILIEARNEAYWELINADSNGASFGLEVLDKECFALAFR